MQYEDDADAFRSTTGELHAERANANVRPKGKFAVFWNNLGFFFSQTFKQIKKGKLSYCTGFVACMIVVTFVAIIYSAMDSFPVVVLQMAESNQGQIDLLIQAGDWTGSGDLNYTLISEVMSKQGDPFHYHTPRYDFSVLAYPFKDCAVPAESLQDDTSWTYLGLANDTACAARPDITDQSCIKKYCGAAHEATVYLTKSERESMIGLGREWKYGTIAQGQAIISSNMAIAMGLSKGDKFFVRFNLASDPFRPLLNDVVEQVDPDMLYTSRWYQLMGPHATVNLPLTVGEVSESVYGKTSLDEYHACFVEYDTFLGHLLERLHPAINATIRETLASRNLDHFAQEVIFNIPPPRYRTYLDLNYDSLQDTVVEWSSSLLYRLGFNQVSVSMPVLRGMQSMSMFSMFLSLVLSIIITILVALSVLLIYSLLMISVDTRTFELGVLRMIGMRRTSVVGLLLTQSLAYSVPSWALGLIIAQLANVVRTPTHPVHPSTRPPAAGKRTAVRLGPEASHCHGLPARHGFLMRFFARLATVEVPWNLTGQSIGLATLVCPPPPPFPTPSPLSLAPSHKPFVISTAASVFPIRSALTKNLHDSLDVTHSKTSAVLVTIERAEDSSVPWTLFVTGGLLSVIGAGVYYFFPLSLVSNNFQLLLYLFFGMLMGMILGLVMLSLNFEHLLERGVRRLAQPPTSLASLASSPPTHPGAAPDRPPSAFLPVCVRAGAGLQVVGFFLFWEKRALRDLAVKNLVAHRLRNRKTTLMYAISIGFIIFISVTAKLNIESFKFNTIKQHGVRMKCQAGGYDATGHIHGVQSAELLEALPERFPGKRPAALGASAISNVGRVFSYTQWLYAIQPHYFDVCLPGSALHPPPSIQPPSQPGRRTHLTISGDGNDDGRCVGGRGSYMRYDDADTDPEVGWGLEEQLYSPSGSHSLLIGATFKEKLLLDRDTHFVEWTTVSTYPYSNVTRRRMTAAGFLQSTPIFTISGFPTATAQDALAAFPTYVRLSNGQVPSVDDIPMRYFLLHLADNLTDDETDEIQARPAAPRRPPLAAPLPPRWLPHCRPAGCPTAAPLAAPLPPHRRADHSITVNDDGVWIWDYRTAVQGLTAASSMIDLFFLACTVVAMLLCFFSLMSSMYTNVFEQTKEIGIMRALGLTQWQMYRLYVEEAFTLVVSASVMGIVTGTLIGYTMTLQQSLFTQLPIPFYFPWSLLVAVIVLSVVCSVMAAAAPTRNLLGKPIVSIMRLVI
ncbi:putative DUF214 family protein [Paratrimastix pyriformis]|uniref:DUF214 family protein n=1 Tax=Paratrimastix pyriformis TaxID=342808 RepID=A0ABQ8UV89_9EUKA|nr:putative DUF214 family protein [Paratrimastix pyriformis]